MTCAALDRDELLSVPEAASRFKLSEDTIYKWIKCGAVPALRLGPSKEIRVYVRDLVSTS